MINIFKVKKWAALLLMGFFPVLSFYIVLLTYNNQWTAMGVMALVIIVFFIIAVVLMKHPFTGMIEGKGLLCLNIDSTGVIIPFLLNIEQPYVKGKRGNTEITDIYDRETVYQFSQMAKGGKAIITKDGKLIIELSDEQYHKSRFGMFQYPCLIYNGQVKSLITKDFLSEMEKTAFAEHTVLYLNRKMEELTSVIRDFGRYVVELLKPKESIWKSKWVLFVMIIIIIILIALFAKPIIQTMMGAGSQAMSSVETINPVTPR